MKRYIFICGFLFLSGLITAKTVVIPVKEKIVKNGQSLFYALPKNILAVEVKTVHTILKRGPYYRYAGRYLGDGRIVTEDADNWRIDGIKVRRIAETDTNCIYQIKAGGKSQLNNLTFDANGFLCGVNSPTDELKPAKESVKFKMENLDLSFDYCVLNEDVLVANSTAKMAELAAKQIYRIRESRTSLLSGDLDFPADGESLRLVLAKMDENERKLLELFFGKKVEVPVVKTIFYEPTQNVEEVLFRMSEKEGLVDKDDLVGTPIYIKVDVLKRDLNLHPKKKLKGGLYYRVPGKANVTVSDDGKVYLKRLFTIAQLGDVVLLPRNSAKKNRKIVFDSQTGALRQIEK